MRDDSEEGRDNGSGDDKESDRAKDIGIEVLGMDIDEGPLELLKEMSLPSQIENK